MPSINKGNPAYRFLGGGFLNVAAPLITGFLGYRGARDQANQQQAQNQLLAQNYEWQKAKEAPGVAGAQEIIENRDQFQPFIDAAGRQSVGASNVASQYLGNVPYYQQAGLQGLGQLQSLLGTTPYQQQQLASAYSNPYAQSQYRLLAQDVNREFDRANRERAARSGGRLDALSSQQARLQGQLEKQRQEGLLRAATQIGSEAHRYGADAANRELARQQSLAGGLLSAGTSGLSQAQQAAQLGSGAQQFGIRAPFLPFQQYGQTISAQPAAQAPNYGTVTDPFSTGIGLGLQTYNLLNKDK